MLRTLPLPPSTENPKAPSPVPDAVIARMQKLYEQGLYLQAYEEAARFCDPRLWIGMRARVWASRLANNLGAPRLGNARALQAFRQDPGDAEALFYAVGSVLNGKGPLAALRFLDRHEPRIAAASTERRADLVAIRARLLALFRDFDRAEALIGEAKQMCPESPWILVEQSVILRSADKFAESLEAAAAALALNPRHRPAVQALAQAQNLLGQADAAFALIQRSALELESGALWLGLNEFHIEREDFAAAAAGYAQYARLSPMMEPGIARWLAGARAKVAYLAGERAQAAEFAKAAGGYYYGKMARNIETAPVGARRVELPVPFLRQKHMTCAPACLAMIGHYYQMASDQDEIAAEICYDGTEDHKERHWAERNGYTVKEFSVDWAATVALIDRGVPFCLNTQETSSAHLQIVMGYDAVLGLLLIRDPYTKAVGEFLAEDFFKRYAHNGPRGMAMVPKGKDAVLAGVPFVDAPFHEARHIMRRAFLVHDRARAVAALNLAHTAHPGHWLTLSMRLDLARYDSDGKAVLELTSQLYAMNPLNKRYLHYRLNTLREHARQDVRVALLEELVKKPGCDPVFYVQLADELRFNRQRVDEAESLLLRAIALRPGDGATYWYLADIRRQSRDWAESAQLSRLAACLDDKNEFLATAYFGAARFVDGAVDEALDFLRRRVDRFGQRSAGPARSLHAALLAAERTQESFAVLDDALKALPDDGELMLYAADAFARHGHDERADELLAKAKGRVQALEYFETLATTAQRRGERRAALEHWRQVCALNPQAVEAHNQVASLLERMRSKRQAVAYMQDVVAKQPDNRYLRKALVEWLRDHDSPELEAALRGLIEVWPQDAWARREMALYCAGSGRFDDADQALAEAKTLDPDSYGYHYACGYVLRLRGDLPGAQAAFLRALERSVDSSHALTQALRAAASATERAAVARRMLSLLLDGRTTLGEGITAFFEQGTGHLPEDEMLAALGKIHAAFEHLPESWAALVAQKLRCARGAADLAAAVETAREAAARFPLHQGTWLTLAEAHGAAGDEPSVERALAKAIEAQPANGAAVRRLAEFHERRGDFVKEQRVLEAALARSPLDHATLGYLADCLWRRGAKRPAIERLKDSLKINLRVDWAWAALAAWTAALGEPETASAFARDLAEKRGDDAWAWTCLARSLRAPEHFKERLAALDHALALDGELFEAHELKVDLLHAAGCLDEALAVIRSADLPLDKQQKLRCKEARLLLEAGEAGAAADVVAMVLAAEPLHHDGMTIKADAAHALEDWEGYLAASIALATHHPKISTSHGYLGDARLKLNDLAGAKAAFQKALDLAPEYDFAAYYLFDLQLADKELEPARATLALLTAVAAGRAPVLQRQGLLAAVARDEAALAAAVANLCAGAETEEYRLAKVVDAAFEQGMAAGLVDTLAALVRAPATAVMAVQPYLRLAADGGDFERGRELLSEDLADHLWRLAAVSHLQALVDGRQIPRFLALVTTHAQRLKAHDSTWAGVGQGYFTFKMDRQMAAWLADWRQRPDSPAWLLYNLSIALRRLGRNDEAGLVNIAAAAATHLDQASAAPFLWAAYHLATVGDGPAARALLKSLPAQPLGEQDATVWAMTQAALHFDEAGGGARGFWRALQAMRRTRRWRRGPFGLRFFDKPMRGGVRRLGRTAGWPWSLLARWEGYFFVVGALIAALAVLAAVCTRGGGS